MDQNAQKCFSVSLNNQEFMPGSQKYEYILAHYIFILVSNAWNSGFLESKRLKQFLTIFVHGTCIWVRRRRLLIKNTLQLQGPVLTFMIFVVVLMHKHAISCEEVLHTTWTNLET